MAQLVGGQGPGLSRWVLATAQAPALVRLLSGVREYTSGANDKLGVMDNRWHQCHTVVRTGAH